MSSLMGYIEGLESEIIHLKSRIKYLENEITTLAAGNLAAQHRAAVEGTRLRELVKSLEDRISKGESSVKPDDRH